MILRLADSFSRALLLTASLLLTAVVSFFAVRMALAARASEGQTGVELRKAAKWEPRNPEYWYRLGHYEQFNLEEPNPERAVESLQKAVALNPQYTDAWLDLATTYELESKDAAANAAYVHAQASYPASAEVAWRYGNFLLRRGDLPQAFSELRRAIIADPKRAAAAFSRVYRADPNVDEILENVLPKIPSAYTDVIAEATASGQLTLAQMMWVKLLAMAPHLQVREFEPLVEALLEAKEYAAARRVWNQGTETMKLQPLRELPGTVVWDPSFESGIHGSTFSWSYKPLEQGVQIVLDSSEQHSGNQSLRASFNGKGNPSLDIACTRVIVSPGSVYALSGWVMAHGVTTDRGVKLRIRGADDQGNVTTDTEEVSGTTAWKRVSIPWSAGSDTHFADVCVSRDPSSNPDVRISGDVWFDDVNLVPTSSPEQTKP